MPASKVRLLAVGAAHRWQLGNKIGCWLAPHPIRAGTVIFSKITILPIYHFTLRRSRTYKAMAAFSIPALARISTELALRRSPICTSGPISCSCRGSLQSETSRETYPPTKLLLLWDCALSIRTFLTRGCRKWGGI